MKEFDLDFLHINNYEGIIQQLKELEDESYLRDVSLDIGVHSQAHGTTSMWFSARVHLYVEHIFVMKSIES